LRRSDMSINLKSPISNLQSNEPLTAIAPEESPSPVAAACVPSALPSPLNSSAPTRLPRFAQFVAVLTHLTHLTYLTPNPSFLSLSVLCVLCGFRASAVLSFRHSVASPLL